MELLSVQKGEVVVIRISGRVLSTDRLSLKEKLEAIYFQENQPFIVINMQGIQYFGSSALCVLVHIYQKIKERNRNIVLCHVPQMTRLLMQTSGVDRIFIFFENEDGAVNSFTAK